jgi:hypothetical protein
MHPLTATDATQRAHFVRDRIPPEGLFAGHEWRISPQAFQLSPGVAREFETLGRVLLQFYRAVNRLYHASREGKQPSWVAEWLELGKSKDVRELQNAHAFKNDVPRVIRPDVLLTDGGLSIIELDSVPGGIGLTAWLNQTYSALEAEEGARTGVSALPPGPDADADKSVRVTAPRAASKSPAVFNPGSRIIGGADGMHRGFAGIFGKAPHVHIVISEEAATYTPEMQWIAAQLDGARFSVRPATFKSFKDGESVYRFFEMFDLANVPNAATIFEWALNGRLNLTPAPKPILEEKMLFALLWNRNLRDFWRQQLGESFFQRLLNVVPYSWVVSPEKLPPHAAVPHLEITDWQQLKALSQRERDLILKVSGYSPEAWGARGVVLGSDASQSEWSAAVDKALDNFNQSPCVLQRYHKPRLVDSAYYDFDKQTLIPMPGRVRLCPYYFVIGDGDAARAHLGGVLATICPADKKIIHGMTEAILAPCVG